ncbi:MAG: DNA-3-methyladenine glycosylase I [Marinilabiliales bacterium]|nr:MAG: DNA-3-methyladenine glycosylase I [Marinilabiliales bacterium]
MMKRCKWVGDDALMKQYHDEEWGVPVHDDTKLFEFIILDGFQAGLSWRTILHKRDNFRKALDYFDADEIADYNEKKIQELLNNNGIVRNKLKIKACITNAQAFLKIQMQYGSFDRYIWQFTEGRTITNQWQKHEDIPVTSKESDAMSKGLKSKGFSFVGSTICYAFMQAAGMVNDHTTDCFRYGELLSEGHKESHCKI